jgi:hypothetical protein
MVPALGFFAAVAPAAYASAPQLSVVASDTGTCTIPCTTPSTANIAQIPVLLSAANPANGDVAIVNVADDYVYLVAGSTTTEFGMSVVQGDTYLLGGDGPAGTTHTSFGVPATSTDFKVGAVAFDASGNLLLTSGTAPAGSVDFIASSSTSTGTYGHGPVTAGDVYEIATTGTPSSPVVALPSGIPANFTGSSLAVGPYGDIFVGVKNSGIVEIDEQAAASVAFGQALAPQTATVIAGSATGTQASLSDGSAAAVSGSYIYNPHLAVDGYGNVIFATTSTTAVGTTPDTVWLLPAVQGVSDGTSASFGPYGHASVTAGDLYLLAGAPGTTTENLANVAATGTGGAAFNDVDAVAVDPAGNVVLGDGNTYDALAVLAESSVPAYNIAAGSWTVGHVYTISGGAAATSTTPGAAATFELPPVDSVSYAQGDLYVAAYNTEAGTPAALYQVTGAPGMLTQAAPTAGSATAGTAYSNQLNVSGASGNVTYATKMNNSPSGAPITVSSTGAISWPSPVAGTYTVSGTASDTSGNAGSWAFTLTVSPSSGQVPESPYVPLLPVGALLLAGGALLAFRLRRRGASHT